MYFIINQKAIFTVLFQNYRCISYSGFTFDFHLNYKIPCRNVSACSSTSLQTHMPVQQTRKVALTLVNRALLFVGYRILG